MLLRVNVAAETRVVGWIRSGSEEQYYILRPKTINDKKRDQK